MVRPAPVRVRDNAALAARYRPAPVAYGGGTKTQRDLGDNPYAVEVRPGRDTRIDETPAWSDAENQAEMDNTLREGAVQAIGGWDAEAEMKRRTSEMEEAARLNTANQAQQVAMTTPVQPPSPDLINQLNSQDALLANAPTSYDEKHAHSDDDPPMPPAGGAPANDPKQAVMAQFLAGQQKRYNLSPDDPRYLSPGQDTAAMRFAASQSPDEDVMTSTDRLPVVGIRKARTRRVLIV